MSLTLPVSRSNPNDGPVLRATLDRIVPIVLALAVTLTGILLVNPHSLLNFAWYFLLFLTFFFVFHRSLIPDYILGFVVNSSFISIYYIIQTAVFPESFGTSSPFGSYTDDSFFFALSADSIPNSLLLRDNYSLYSEPFSQLIRLTSIVRIDHPMDAIFFQSGTAAILVTFLKQFTLQHTANDRTANVAYILALICPFLMMNGGVLLIRDTFSAALFIYSLACLNKSHWPLALVAILLQVIIRPGTGIILAPLYFIIYFPSVRDFSSGRVSKLLIGLPIGLVVVAWIALSVLDLSRYQSYLSQLSFSGRDTMDALNADPNANGIQVAIQNQPFLLRFLLNGAYIFLYPFLSLKAAMPNGLFDARSMVLSIIAPVEGFWLNAWFFAAAFSRKPAANNQRQVAMALLVAMLVIGTYSMQTRHKTIIYPIYYYLVAIGFVRSSSTERRVGYAISGVLIGLQIVFLAR